MVKRTAEHIAHGQEIYSGYITTSVGMKTDFHALVRSKALEEGRSFSNMVVILLKRGLKVDNVPK